MADDPPSADRIDAAIVARLIEARRSQGLRQVDVATRLGRPQAYVSRYETRETMLGVGDLFVVANALGIDPIRLLVDLQIQNQKTPKQRAGASRF